MPGFNNPNEQKALYCNDCKKCGMVDIKHKKCVICNLMPIFNYTNEKQAFYCNDCKKCGMINIKDKRCVACNLARADKKYNNHYAFCFVNVFPNDPKSIKARTST